MPPECNLTVQPQNGSREIKVLGHFSDDEWQRLHKYVQYSEELMATPIIQADGLNSNLHFSFTQEKGLVSKSTLPQMDHIRILLHKARPLILESEPTAFLQVRSILAHRLENEFIRAMLDEQKDMFTGKQSQAVFTIKINDVILNSERFLFKWLNAHEYHRDEDKQRELSELLQAFPEHASRAIWISLLIDKCNAIFSLATFVSCAVGKQKKVSATIHLKTPPN